MNIDNQIKVKTFPKTKDIIYHKTLSHTTAIYIHEEKGASRTHAILELVLSGDRGDTQIRLHPDVHFIVRDGKIIIKTNPKDTGDNFKLLASHFQMAWVTERTFLEYMSQFCNHNLKPGAR